MRQKRVDREEKEKLEALEKERMRIKSGKDMTEVKRKMEEDEMKKIVDQRKREKEEEKLARQRVRDLIEADKAARKARNSGIPIESPTPIPSSSTQKPSPLTNTISTPQKDYKESRIQIRLPDGTSFVETFDKNEQLAAVRLFLQLKLVNESLDAFTMMTTFPRKVFTSDDYELTLEKLQLVPSATIMVTKNAKPGM